MDDGHATGALGTDTAPAPAAVTLDLILPRLSGLHLAKALHEHDPALPLIAVSAVRTRDRLVAAKEAGVRHYVVKPIDRAKLVNTAQAYAPEGAVARAKLTGERVITPELSAFEQAVDKLDEIETLPAVARRLIAVTSDPDCCIDDVHQLISSDQALATRVLAIANSPAYCMGAAVSDLKAAVLRLGLKEIRTMAVTASVVPGSAVTPFDQQLWRHTLHVAALSAALGRDGGIQDVVDPFLCGLLHEFGTLALARVRGDAYIEAIGAPGSDAQLAAERELLGFDHCDVGSIVSSRWNLGADVEFVIQFHHDPAEMEPLGLPSSTRNAVTLVALSRRLVQSLDDDGHPTLDDQTRALMQQLGVADEVVVRCVEGAAEQVADLCSALGV